MPAKTTLLPAVGNLPASAIPANKWEDAREIFDLLATEVYHGFNARCVLSESTPEERDAIRAFCERAKAGRSA